MKIVATFAAGLALAAMPVLAAAQPLSKQNALQLTQLGLGDDAIVAKISADKVDFDLSTDEMIALRKQGVSSAVIAAMISNRYQQKAEMSLDSPDPAVPHPAGLYAVQDIGHMHMLRMDSTVTNQAKTGGLLGYAFTGGIASMSVKASIQKETSAVPVQRQPRFYFFSAESNGSDGGAWASGTNTVVASPAELTLIRLTRKDGRREARVGSVNIAGAKTGVMDKDRIEFRHELVRPGVYRIDVTQPLEPGEYGFIYSLAGSGSAGAMTARIFDFTVQ
ncbi:hypothetical protein EDF56_101236 [Novosphingobium sp. PhB165]|uniref:hypothetical protein n=1 Tax=Novosphingobium sp. PhB165 TaxID=2485105 RepID=UPI0010478FD6|nr:hypothetical protein [Novosphingobium sp. PhB165]TCM21571.1 hypothetical protein EDF56_101236 [Novosphingobium sp. PhB165]